MKRDKKGHVVFLFCFKQQKKKHKNYYKKIQNKDNKSLFKKKKIFFFLKRQRKNTGLYPFFIFFQGFVFLLLIFLSFEKIRGPSLLIFLSFEKIRGFVSLPLTRICYSSFFLLGGLVSLPRIF